MGRRSLRTSAGPGPPDGGQERAARAPGVQVAGGFGKAGGGEQVELERPAVDGRSRRPAPLAPERSSEGAHRVDDATVGSVVEGHRVEDVVGQLAVVRVATRTATVGRADAVEDAGHASQPAPEPDRADGGPPAVALVAVDLDPPVPVHVEHRRVVALDEHPLHETTGDGVPVGLPSGHLLLALLPLPLRIPTQLRHATPHPQPATLPPLRPDPIALPATVLRRGVIGEGWRDGRVHGSNVPHPGWGTVRLHQRAPLADDRRRRGDRT